jgi:hypothetical protein
VVLVEGGTTTLTSLGGDEPPPLVELHAVRVSMVRTRTAGIILLAVILNTFILCFVKDDLQVIRFNQAYTY